MDSIVSILIGAVCIVLGIINRTGNISLLHSYHRKRVAEEDRLPMGKLIGLGTIIAGFGLILMGIMSLVATNTQQNIYNIIGCIALGVCLVVGLGINFYAIQKYNKGIF